MLIANYMIRPGVEGTTGQRIPSKHPDPVSHPLKLARQRPFVYERTPSLSDSLFSLPRSMSAVVESDPFLSCFSVAETAFLSVPVLNMVLLVVRLFTWPRTEAVLSDTACLPACPCFALLCFACRPAVPVLALHCISTCLPCLRLLQWVRTLSRMQKTANYSRLWHARAKALTVDVLL